MNVPSDLADKVLQADARNIVKNVGDDTPLTGPQRDMMQAFAMTPEMARQARAYAFIQRYCDGHDLTAQQWVEIREVYPNFGPGSAVPPAPESAGESFALNPEPAQSELTKPQIAELQELYGVGRRQLFRWKKEGAPLADPAAMPAWYSRTHKWSVPDSILTAAKRAAAVSPPSEPPAPTAGAAPATGTTATAPPVGPERTVPILDLAALEYDPNTLVANAAKRVRAIEQRLDAAYAGRSTEDPDFLDGRLTKAVEMLRKLKDSDQKMKVAMGKYTPTDEIDRALATLVELLRQMDETEIRRVDELCPSLTPDARREMASAIARVGEARRRIFRKLGSIKSIDDAVLELAAA